MPISYEEALDTLLAMFGHQGYTSAQLDAVLRHHGGHMEHTVETILGHGEGSPDDLVKNLKNIPPGGSGASGSGGDASPGGGTGSEGGGHTIDTDEELARQLAADDERRQNRGARGGGSGGAMFGVGGGGEEGGGGSGAVGLSAGRGVIFPAPGRRRAPAITPPLPPAPPANRAAPPATQKKGRGTSTALPNDFLRIPGRKYPSGGVSSATPSGAVPVAGGGGNTGMTDEQLARMLQDELFQEELRSNPEFSHLAGRRNPRAGANRQQQTARSNAWGGGGGGGGGGEFFNQLKDMGDTAKRRFQEIAATWGENAGNANRGGGGFVRASGGRGGTSERRGLLDDNEEELNFQESATGQSVELQDVGRGNGSKKKD